MSRAEDRLLAALKALPPKPADSAAQATKRRYLEQMSNAIAEALAAELRDRGLDDTRPAPPGPLGRSGAERRLAGGLGAKKVDVSWATAESGLLFAISVKTINFKDGKTKNFQKNLTNRRSDMLNEATTLHRRQPYAVLLAMLFIDKDAEHDGTTRRRSTFENAFPRLRLFSGRRDPAGRDEQYEQFYIALVDANPFSPSVKFYDAADASTALSLDAMLTAAMTLIAERNFDFYEEDGAGGIRKT